MSVCSRVSTLVVVIRNCEQCESNVGLLGSFSLFVVNSVFDTVVCVRFVCVLQGCVRADVPLSPRVRTDALTPVGGDCGKGV